MEENKQTIEVCCGTKSFSKVAEEEGYKTFTIDNEKRHNADLCIDILKIKSKDLPQRPFILWASPPCTKFSVASIGTSWCGKYCPAKSETALGMAYVY